MEIGPLALAERRLAWLDGRQRVLAQNVANADTPGYLPRDVRAFEAVLSRRTAAATLAATDARHLEPSGGQLARAGRGGLDVAPNGNGVSLEEQAMKIAETDQAHALAMGLHRKYLALFRTALGRN
ncbi:flagellar basal body protein [Roseococcus sp. DSY-14]|uniref:flagellar basal body protein n=1 Tax=Roseococcus sp. DSY-14 TaxID=3369650 RepID=UPI00387B7372